MDARTTTALLYLDGVTVSFDGFRALNNLSFTIEPGEMRAIIGPNGAGKTTLIHQISGALAPDAGRIHFDGRDVTGLPMPARAHLGLARTFQITHVLASFTVLENVALAVQARAGSSFRFWRAAAGRSRVGFGPRG